MDAIRQQVCPDWIDSCDLRIVSEDMSLTQCKSGCFILHTSSAMASTRTYLLLWTQASSEYAWLEMYLLVSFSALLQYLSFATAPSKLPSLILLLHQQSATLSAHIMSVG